MNEKKKVKGQKRLDQEVPKIYEAIKRTFVLFVGRVASERPDPEVAASYAAELFNDSISPFMYNMLSLSASFEKKMRQMDEKIQEMKQLQDKLQQDMEEGEGWKRGEGPSNPDS